MLGVLLVAVPARASDDDDWLLRAICAGLDRGSIPWDLLGCDAVMKGSPIAS